MRAALSDRLLFSEALEVVGVMLRGYANGGAQAGGSYQGALAELLTRYPRCIVAYAGDVGKGVPSTTRFLPTPADVAAWCERELAEWQAIVARDDHERKMRADVRDRAKNESDLAADRALRPTLKQMQDQYGPNWGLGEGDKEDLLVKASRREKMIKANRLMFERECNAAGIDPARGCSPELVHLLGSEIRMRKAERLGEEADRLSADAAE